MHILIVDDEELARLRLRRLIEQLPDCEIIGEASSGEEALAQIEELDPELVLLDVRMPGLNGMEVAKQLSEHPDPPAVIFCTAYDEYALQAFDTLAQGYIVKPVQLEQLAQLIEKTKKLTRVQSRQLQSVREHQRQHISAKTRHGLELIPIDNVYCFIADQKYVTVMHQAGDTLVDDTLKELEEELGSGFVRIHRNALVSVAEIEALERDSVGHFSLRLKSSGYQPQVSRRHVASVRELLEGL